MSWISRGEREGNTAVAACAYLTTATFIGAPHGLLGLGSNYYILTALLSNEDGLSLLLGLLIVLSRDCQNEFDREELDMSSVPYHWTAGNPARSVKKRLEEGFVRLHVCHVTWLAGARVNGDQ